MKTMESGTKKMMQVLCNYQQLQFNLCILTFLNVFISLVAVKERVDT